MSFMVFFLSVTQFNAAQQWLAAGVCWGVLQEMGVADGFAQLSWTA
jgi:hypothetical protein